MSRKISFLMKPGENSYRFPVECVYCGDARTSPLVYKNQSKKLISRAGDALVKHLTYWKYSVILHVPYCQEHLRVSRIAKPVLAIAAVVGFLLGGAVLYGLISLSPRDLFSSASGGVAKDVSTVIVVVGILTFLIFPIGGSVLAQWLAKVLVARFLHSSFMEVPILAWLVDNDITRPHTLGMGVKIDEESITFSFTNDQIGEEFERLNLIHQ